VEVTKTHTGWLEMQNRASALVGNIKCCEPRAVLSWKRQSEGPQYDPGQFAKARASLWS